MISGDGPGHASSMEVSQHAPFNVAAKRPAIPPCRSQCDEGPIREMVTNHGCDGAFVTMRADGMLIRFEKGRADFNVRVTSTDRPLGWADLELLIAAIETPDDVRRRGVPDAWVAGRLLDKYWDCLNRALQSDSTREVLREFHTREEVHRKAFERELNRRLYGK